MNWKKILPFVLCAALVFSLLTGCAAGNTESSRRLPVLMYHHFVTDEATLSTEVTEERFREQMSILHEAGYTSVTLQELLNYVNGDGDLPEKPVLITFDDGYTSNLDIAAPILEEYGFCATIFVIGINEGELYYAHSGEPIWMDRFAFEEASDWVEKGVLDIQSHTFDMHQLASYGYSGRDGMLAMDGESEADYYAAILEDLDTFAQRRGDRVATDLIALSYPFGYYTEELDSFLAQQGIQITVTVEEHTNVLRRGDPSSLRMLGRFNVTDKWRGAQLVLKLEHSI
jgi:peptidoglycan/xylan/chitin deacetylase (PgdA/CDA1 family)